MTLLVCSMMFILGGWLNFHSELRVRGQSVFERVDLSLYHTVTSCYCHSAGCE